MDRRQAFTILEEIARSTSDPRWKDALAYALGRLKDHHHQSSRDDDDDDESQRLAAKFHIDPETYAKLKAIKGDETPAIVQLASNKNNPKGYILTVIRNAEKEREREDKRAKGIYEPGDTVEYQGETYVVPREGQLPMHVRMGLGIGVYSRKNQEREEQNERAYKVRQRLYKGRSTV